MWKSLHFLSTANAVIKPLCVCQGQGGLHGAPGLAAPAGRGGGGAPAGWPVRNLTSGASCGHWLLSAGDVGATAGSPGLQATEHGDDSQTLSHVIPRKWCCSWAPGTGHLAGARLPARHEDPVDSTAPDIGRPLSVQGRSWTVTTSTGHNDRTPPVPHPASALPPPESPRAGDFTKETRDILGPVRHTVCRHPGSPASSLHRRLLRSGVRVAPLT